MSNPTRLLIITYHFPPGGGVSVQRVLGFSRHLPDNAFSVRVLTARNGAYPVYDPGLLRLVPAEVEVHRSFTPEIPYQLRKRIWSFIGPRRVGNSPGAARPDTVDPKRKNYPRDLFCPDIQVLWNPFAIRKARALIRKHAIEVVLVTAPPFSSFLIGCALKREFPRLLLVSDFRDEWLEYYLGNVETLGSEYKLGRAREIERETILRSDLVVATTQSTLRRIRVRYPVEPAEKFVHIPNGYEPDRVPRFQRRGADGRSTMVIGYMGTVYGPCSPERYLEAMRGLPLELRERIETRFIGRITDGWWGVLERSESRISVLGFLPQDQAYAQLGECDYVLLIVDDVVSVAGKTFEYLAMGKPILALAPPDSETTALLQETGGAVCADSRDVGAIREAILRIFSGFSEGEQPPEAMDGRLTRYERPKSVAELACHIHEKRARLLGQPHADHH